MAAETIMTGLDRFLTAQDGIYDQALAELRRGHKESHWMWFIFPQIAGLGRSYMAQHYAIASLAEARDYLAHPLLGPRLAACTDAVLGNAGVRNAVQIFGPVDAVKLRSSMTLFDRAGADRRYDAVLRGFFDGEPDQATLQLLML
jgi:uncharacterized protein (DUF1810 family)